MQFSVIFEINSGLRLKNSTMPLSPLIIVLSLSSCSLLRVFIISFNSLLEVSFNNFSLVNINSGTFPSSSTTLL